MRTPDANATVFRPHSRRVPAGAEKQGGERGCALRPEGWLERCCGLGYFFWGCGILDGRLSQTSAITFLTCFS